jgi:hypothetical protein
MMTSTTISSMSVKPRTLVARRQGMGFMGSVV